MNGRARDLDRFYELLAVLEHRCGGIRTLHDCNARSGWPQRGVYFFFEPDEFRRDGITRRVVRVGTHGLRPSKSSLWQRLAQHKGSPGGSLPGGGNHRASIFRLHVGTALLAVGGQRPAEITRTWALASTANAEIRQREHALEIAVSQFIGSMPFLWLAVNDPPGSQSDRGRIEAGSIAMLSNLERAAHDLPSPSWLGNHAASPMIRKSGLWNVNHVADTPDPEMLDLLAKYVHRHTN